tara:strand:- start:311 stop:814 length:504 start_codon:yes stop_codon:yes gene_type:complete
MIISCQKCNKKFEIDSSLIPKNGRLLRCGSCDYEWFFTEQIIKKINLENNQINTYQTDTESKNVPRIIEKEKLDKTSDILEKEKLDITPNILENNLDHDKSEKVKNFKKISFFKVLIIFIISMVSLILIVDTFKKPISVIIPNIEYILYNLYETLKDIKLFFNDLYK